MSGNLQFQKNFAQRAPEQKRGIPKCMKAGPDGSLSLRDQARSIVQSADDPLTAWSRLFSWASSQGDHIIAKKAAVFQFLDKWGRNPDSVAVMPEVLRLASKISHLIPKEARAGMLQLANGSSLSLGLGAVNERFAFSNPSATLVRNLPASNGGPLPVLSFAPSGTLDSPRLGVTQFAPSGDLAQFMQARDTMLRVQDDLHRGMTSLERATLMPGRPDEVHTAAGPTAAQFMSFSKPFEASKMPPLQSHPSKQHSAQAPSFKPSEFKPAASASHPVFSHHETREIPYQPKQAKPAGNSPGKAGKPAIKSAAQQIPQPVFRPTMPAFRSSVPRMIKPTMSVAKTSFARPAVAAKITELPPAPHPPKRRRRKKSKAVVLPVDKQKTKKQEKSMQAGKGHELVRALTQKLRSHAAGEHGHAKRHTHHPGHPAHPKGHVAEKPAKGKKQKREKSKKRKPKKLKRLVKKAKKPEKKKAARKTAVALMKKPKKSRRRR